MGEEKMAEEGADIYDLFCHYNSLYFDDALGCCLLNWASDPPMATCTGTCHYDQGGGCEILLSEPLLKCCSVIDLKNALLHEMIHAFLWIKHKNKDHSDHSSGFQEIRNSINSSSVTDFQRPHGGYDVLLHHEFKKKVGMHEVKTEIKTYKFHYWKCDTCGDYIKRSREPSARDCISKVGSEKACSNLSCHWHNHKSACSGSYTISKPPGVEDLWHEKVKDLPCKQTAKRLSETESTKRSSGGERDSKAEQVIQEDGLSPIGTPCATEGKEKSVEKKAMRIADYFSPVKDASWNLGNNASSCGAPPEELNFGESKPRNLNALISATDSERPERVSKPAPMRTQRCTIKKRKRGGKWKYGDTIEGGCLCAYGSDDEDETMEPLKNKRTERRKRLMLFQIVGENGLETDDEMEDQDYPTSEDTKNKQVLGKVQSIGEERQQIQG